MTLDDDVTFSEDEIAAALADDRNIYLRQPEKAMRLVARLLAAPDAAPPGADELEALRRLVDDGVGVLAQFAGPSGVAAARELDALCAALGELLPFPDLANKVTVGVGGGFSAGKSRFLNTLLGLERDLLPVDTVPTTAIPTYLVAGTASTRALNGMDRLVRIDADALDALAHGFNQQYGDGPGKGIGLAQMIKLLVIQHPALRWQHLALLDTPGYNKPDGHAATLADEAIARAQLAQADHLVWLVHAKAGSLGLEELRFLHSLGHEQPVFFVVTQSDLQTAVPAVLRVIEHEVARAGIACAGIMAWAAEPGQPGRRVAGDDIHAWLDGLDLTPKLKDSRRRAARLMANLREELDGALAEGRQELAVLNGFWSVAGQLPDDTADDLRQLISTRREAQRARSGQRARLEEFEQALDAALGAVHDAMALADARSEEAIERQYQEAMLALLARNVTAREPAIFASLRDAASHGHAGAQYALAECYRLGTGTVIDPVLAFRWCARAASQDLLEAHFRLGICHQQGEGTVVDPVAARRCFEAAAEQDHVQAQMALYSMLVGLDRPPHEIGQGIHWLKRAVALEHGPAEYELGHCHILGLGVGKNRHRASELYQLAAGRGHAPALYEMGRSYQAESAGIEDDIEAARYFRSAADQEHAEATLSIARCYLDGRGVQRNPGRAARWFRRAEQLGHAGGITGLGNCHFAAREFEQAADCYRKAAELDDAEAMYLLGLCYLRGVGVRKHGPRAHEWLEHARQHGHAAAFEYIDEHGGGL